MRRGREGSPQNRDDEFRYLRGKDLNVGCNVRVAALRVLRIYCGRSVAVGRAVDDFRIRIKGVGVRYGADPGEGSAGICVYGAIDVIAGYVR